MKGIKINKPCSENWEGMTPNEKGAFCQKCSKSVYDFTKRSNEEIKSILLKLKGQEVCGRILNTQETALNVEFNAWNLSNKQRLDKAMLFSLIVVFGLSILSCTTEQEKIAVQEFQEKAIVVLEEDVVSVGDSEKEKTVTTVKRKTIEIEQEEALELMGAVVLLEKRDSVNIQDEVLACGTRSQTRIIGMLGGMGISVNYEKYLEDTAPELITEYDELGRILPTEFSATPFPNPTRSISSLKLEIAEESTMRIMLFNMQGQFLSELAHKEYERGTFELPIDLSKKKPGTYIIAISSDNFNETIRVVKQ